MNCLVRRHGEIGITSHTIPFWSERIDQQVRTHHRSDPYSPRSELPNAPSTFHAVPTLSWRFVCYGRRGSVGKTVVLGITCTHCADQISIFSSSSALCTSSAVSLGIEGPIWGCRLLFKACQTRSAPDVASSRALSNSSGLNEPVATA